MLALGIKEFACCITKRFIALWILFHVGIRFQHAFAVIRCTQAQLTKCIIVKSRELPSERTYF